MADVSEVVFNELAFFRLMQNIDSVDNEPRKSDADESEDNLVNWICLLKFLRDYFFNVDLF